MCANTMRGVSLPAFYACRDCGAKWRAVTPSRALALDAKRDLWAVQTWEIRVPPPPTHPTTSPGLWSPPLACGFDTPSV